MNNNKFFFKISKISRFVNISIKNYYNQLGKKSLKWYIRQPTHELMYNQYYKNYIVKHNMSNHPEYKTFFQIFNLWEKNDDKAYLELLPTNQKADPEYDSCLIWLYDGDYIEYFVESLLEYNNFPPKNFKIFFLRAPINPITFDSVVLERAWFNIFNMPDAAGRRDINQRQIESFTKIIHREIQNQYNLIGDYSKIFVGGFSSSACMALYSSLTFNESLGGCLSFNGFNFDFTPIDETKKKMPILLVNGINDEYVIIRHARDSYLNMKKLGFNLTIFEEAGLGHGFTITGLSYANKILSKMK